MPPGAASMTAWFFLAMPQLSANPIRYFKSFKYFSPKLWARSTSEMPSLPNAYGAHQELGGNINHETCQQPRKRC